METTTKPDGTKVQTETKKDGTKVETTTAKDGSTSKTTTNPNGSSVTSALPSRISQFIANMLMTFNAPALCPN